MFVFLRAQYSCKWGPARYQRDQAGSARYVVSIAAQIKHSSDKHRRCSRPSLCLHGSNFGNSPQQKIHPHNAWHKDSISLPCATYCTCVDNIVTEQMEQITTRKFESSAGCWMQPSCTGHCKHLQWLCTSKMPIPKCKHHKAGALL